jgi:hypothetical protein
MLASCILTERFVLPSESQKMEKGEQFDQHSGDAEALAY